MSLCMSLIEEELKEFQLRLEGILKEFLDQDSIEVHGNLKIVVTSFTLLCLPHPCSSS
jgi:hypothetical protein